MRLLRSFFAKFGPGFVTGAADDDPSAVATYVQTGVRFGYSQLWTTIFAIPFMIAVQEMCGRIGLVTGRGLAALVKRRFGKPVLYGAVGLLLVANTATIGADLGAMASAAQLIFGAPFIFWLVLMATVILVLEIFITYQTYVRYLKFFALSLFAYVLVVFVVRQDWGAILYGTLLPGISLTREYLVNIIAILGTTFSPFLFFWQASEENEEEVASGKLIGMGRGTPKINSRDIAKLRLDTGGGMFFSNMIMFFVVIASASTLGRAGYFNVVSVSEAAAALIPLAGPFAGVLFAIGIIGTGLVSVPVLAGSSSYAVAETLGWRSGLYRKMRDAHGFYGVITIATFVGILINFLGIQPFQMLYYTAVLNGIIAPPLLLLILIMGNDKALLGKHVNGRLSNVFAGFITAIMFAASIALLFF